MPFGFSRRNTVRQQHHKTRRAAPNRRRLAFDSLEARQLLSGVPLSPQPVWTVQAPPSTDATATGMQTTAPAISPALPVTAGSTVSPRSIATFGNGDSIATWANQLSDGNYDLMFQQRDAYGNAIGPATMIVHDNNEPAIMVAAQQTSSPGDFVVVWSNLTGINNKGVANYATHAEVWKFGNSPSLSASTSFSGSYVAVSVAMDGSGNFDILDGLSAPSDAVHRYNSSAQALGSAVSVPGAYALATDTAGDYVVSWVSSASGTNSISDYIYAEKFVLSSSGTPVGQGTVLVAQGLASNINSANPTGERLEYPDVAMDAEGDYVVTWRNATPFAYDGGLPGPYGSLWARVYVNGASPTPSIDEAQVTLVPNTGPNGDVVSNYNAVLDQMPAVVAQPGGRGAFDLAWATEDEYYDSTGNHVNRYHVYAEQFDSSGNPSPQGPATVYQSNYPLVSGTLTGARGYVSAAIDANNNLLVTYSINSNETPPPGFTANAAVYTQFYANQRFSLSMPSNVNAGTSFNVTVTATDINGNPNTAYSGTVHFTSTDGQAILPANTTLTNGVGTFTVTLKTAGTQVVNGSDAANELIMGGATVAVAPAAATQFALSAPTKATIGSPVNVTVVAQDAYGNTATGYSGTMHFTSSDGAAVLPADTTLTSGVGTFSVTFNTAGSQSLTAADSADSSITGTAAINVISDATQFAVTTSANSTAGSSFQVTVTALDANGNVVTGYTGAVHLTSSDGQAVLQDGALSNGTGTFTVTLKTAGNQTIKATGANSAGATITGSATLQVAAATASQFILLAPSAVNSGQLFSLTVEVADAFGNIVPTYSGTLQFSCSGSSAVLPPATYESTTSGASFTFNNLSLKHVGNAHSLNSQTITVTDGTLTASIVVQVGY